MSYRKSKKGKRCYQMDLPNKDAFSNESNKNNNSKECITQKKKNLDVGRGPNVNGFGENAKSKKMG